MNWKRHVTFLKLTLKPTSLRKADSVELHETSRLTWYTTMYQHHFSVVFTTFTIQYRASLEIVCKNLDVTFLHWRKCLPLFTESVFKANLLFFKETSVSANRLSEQLGIRQVLATALSHSLIQVRKGLTRLWIEVWLQIFLLHNAKLVKKQICQKHKHFHVKVSCLFL